jgi:hypothetical protein
VICGEHKGVRVSAKTFSLPKNGNSEQEYEDAFYPDRGNEFEGTRLRFAVADGASEAMLSRDWAKILTASFCRSTPDTFGSCLVRAQASWEKWRADYLRKRERNNKPIQWYEEPGLEAGAFATFQGLEFVDCGEDGTNRWRAVAVGDACLFQIRGERLLVKFPIENSGDFTNSPSLVASAPARNEKMLAAVKEASGDWQVDDQFFLATDALACWFLRQTEAGGAPWKTLGDFGTRDERQPFLHWMAALRDSKEIRNDDVTLLRLFIEG